MSRKRKSPMPFSNATLTEIRAPAPAFQFSLKPALAVSAPVVVQQSTATNQDSDAESDFEFDLSALPTSAETPAIQLSGEQQAIVDCVLQGNNVSVIAKAGTGKTTTSLMTAKAVHSQSGMRTLILTYNARLKQETRKAIVKHNLKGIVEAHSYHAAAAKFFSVRGHPNDAWFDRVLKQACMRDLNFGLVIVDEVQDMTPLYYRFVCHLLSFMGGPVQLMVLGDPFQQIFQFHGSTCEYLHHPELHFREHVKEPDRFVTKHLTICWRITPNMADWINENLHPQHLEHIAHPDWWAENRDKILGWWGSGIRANPQRASDPQSVQVIRCNPFRPLKNPRVQHLKQDMDQYPNEEIAVLAYSVKAQSPAQHFVNKTGQDSAINWLVLDQKEGTKQEQTFYKKRVVSSIHQFKGLERDFVTVCGISNWMESLDQDNPLNHFNVVYVAVTRARKRLCLLLPEKATEDYVTIRQLRGSVQPRIQLQLGIKQIIEYVPFDEILGLEEQVFFKSQPLQQNAAVQRTIWKEADRLIVGRFQGTYEDIQTFVGQTVTLRLAQILHGDLYVRREIAAQCFRELQANQSRKKHGTNATRFDPTLVEFLRQFCIPQPDLPLDWLQLFRLAVAADTVSTRFFHYWRQVQPTLDQLPIAFMETCVKNGLALLHTLTMTRTVSELQNRVMFEVPVSFKCTEPWFLQRYDEVIAGRIDMIVDQIHLIEVKVSNHLSLDHMMQAQLYTSAGLIQPKQTRYDPTRIQHTHVMVANLGELWSLQLKPTLCDLTFIQRNLCRKCNVPWSATMTFLGPDHPPQSPVVIALDDDADDETK